MTVLEFLAFAGLGKILMYVFRKFPLVRDIQGNFWKELIDCDLCLGVWMYIGLARLLSFDIYYYYFSYPDILGYLFTGITTSFLTWIFVTGWNANFQIVHLE